jgi:hypothetical protein
MAVAHNVPPPPPHFSAVGKEPTRIAPPLAQLEQPPCIAVIRGMAPILIGTMTESAANNGATRLAHPSAQASAGPLLVLMENRKAP